MASPGTESVIDWSSNSATATYSPSASTDSSASSETNGNDGSDHLGTSSDNTTATSSPPPIKKASDISPGALAGTAIGCLIGGLILGGLIALILLRRKWKKRAVGRRVDKSHVSMAMDTKNFSPAGPVSSVTDTPLAQFLLDATPDKDIATELQSLGDLIHLHVENNYHLQTLQGRLPSLTESLWNLGFTQNVGLGPEVVASICLDKKTRQAGLKHVISHVIFNCIDFQSKSRLSMLPAPIAAFLLSMPDDDYDNGQAKSLALSKWRTLSAFLLHPSRSQRTPLMPLDSSTASQSLALATALNTFLHPFISLDQSSQQQQIEHLQAVIFECTRFGYTIMSQPSQWQYIYESKDSRMLVLCPGVDKLAASDGTRYQTPFPVVAPVLTQI